MIATAQASAFTQQVMNLAGRQAALPWGAAAAPAAAAGRWAQAHPLSFAGLLGSCRQMYSQEYFSRMQTKALQLWEELERESGVQLLKPNGLLFYGETDTGGWVCRVQPCLGAAVSGEG